ncbi:MAG TPA: SCO family protein [Pyrinomonadaceae bacterium]|nr:SCO family protein [Pyrinomonadaceae bacterium]
MTSRILTTALIIGFLCAATPVEWNVIGQTRRKTQQRTARRYACPMHPEVTSTKRGKCPKCGMALRAVPAKGEAAKPESPKSEPSPTPAANEGDSALLSTRIPDVVVFDQNNKQLNFYTDLIKGKTVAINFIFTTCTAICPPLTATFRKVQQELGEYDPNVQLISISVDPVTDTPQRLHDFAAKFKAGPGWAFITGERANIDSLLKALGAASPNKTDHPSSILIANETTGYRTRVYGLSPPSTVVKLIKEAAVGN